MHRVIPTTLVSLTAVVFAATASAQAKPAWKQVYSDPTVTVSIDPAKTKKRADGSYSLALRWKYAADQRIGGGKTYRTLVEKRFIDCKTLRTTSVSAESFTAAGKSVSSYSTPEADLTWVKRPASTSSAKAHAGVCESLAK